MSGEGAAAWRKLAAIRLLALAGAVAACALAGGCGGSSGEERARQRTSAATARSTATAASDLETIEAKDYARVDGDRDNDLEAGALDDKNNDSSLRFGHAAAASDQRALAALIERYYAVALSGDGAKGCALLNAGLAEIAAEDYGAAGGPTYVRGAKTCREVLAGVFRFNHTRLAAEVPHLAVTAVRLKSRVGYALLSFGRFGERQLSVQREGGGWRIAALMDAELP